MVSLQSRIAAAALNVWPGLCLMAPAGLEGREGGDCDTLWDFLPLLQGIWARPNSRGWIFSKNALSHTKLPPEWGWISICAGVRSSRSSVVSSQAGFSLPPLKVRRKRCLVPLGAHWGCAGPWHHPGDASRGLVVGGWGGNLFEAKKSNLGSSRGISHRDTTVAFPSPTPAHPSPGGLSSALCHDERSRGEQLPPAPRLVSMVMLHSTVLSRSGCISLQIRQPCADPGLWGLATSQGWWH